MRRAWSEGFTAERVFGTFAADLMRPYVAAAKAAGDPVQTLAPPGADHFDVVTPDTPNGRAVVDFVATNLLPLRR